jgi:hypothetical protein
MALPTAKNMIGSTMAEMIVITVGAAIAAKNDDAVLK